MVPADGAVLCGGASRRMGTDKAYLVVDGVPMYRRVLDALAGAVGAGSLVVVGGDPTRLGPGETNVADRWPGEGPLGGIITALDGPGSSPAVAVLSCDLVDPDADVIARVTAARADGDTDVAVPVVGGREQWTHAVWHRRITGPLEDRFDAGTRAIHAAVGGLTVTRIELPDDVLDDADRPEDLP